MTTVKLSSHARRNYLKLARSDRRLFARVDRVLEQLRTDATSGKPLTGPLSGHRSLRVGSLRIVYRFDEARRLIMILDIAQRGDVYR